MQVAIYGNTTWVHAKAKGVYFYLQALSAKGWSPKGRRGTENTPPAGGIRTCDLLVYRHMPSPLGHSAVLNKVGDVLWDWITRVGAQNLEIHCNCILKLFRKVSTHKIYRHTEWCPMDCKCGVKISSQNHHIAIKIKFLSWGLQCERGSTEATWKLPLNRN